MEPIKRWKFNLINKSGKQESWTGSFKTEELADKWYNNYGIQWEKEGKDLIKVEYYIEG